MAKNSNINYSQNNPIKGLQTDYSETNNDENIWIYARNAVINSKNGDIIHLQNEPSTEFCAEFPYSYNGSIKLKNNRFVIFTTDNVSSEIGIFNSKECSYSTLVNNACLNFNTSNPIFGTSKENYDDSESIYFADGQLNNIRTLNLDRIPYTYTEFDDECKTKEYTSTLDCNELSFTKKFSIPCISVKKGTSGILKNGAYQFAIAYSMSSQRATDYFSVTSPFSIWSHKNNSGSLDLSITNIDRDFETYQLLVAATIEGQTFYKIIGEFSTSQTFHSISNINKPEYIDVPLEEISVKKQYYQKADYLASNDQYLFLSGTSVRPQLNYQKQALSIVTKYVVYKVPVDFYSNYNDTGYPRDEVQPFSIQWVYDDGEFSELFHIKGREANDYELGSVSGDDVFEARTECDSPKETLYWQVYNTASKFKMIDQEFRECDKSIIGEGDMAFWQSTDLYPDNVDMFGVYACTPIKHSKTPDESKVPRFSIDENGKVFINVLGVKFENIEHPLDKNNQPIPNITGYRIWRADRAGNNSVVATGIMTNVRKYTDSKTKKTYSYSNYPYNSTKPDLFISEKQTYNKANGEKDYIAPKMVSDTEFTFYSPQCLIDRVGLGDYVVFNTQETAAVEGFFNEVFKHPKAKLLSDKVLYYAIIIGAIDGILKTFVGSRCETKYTPDSIVTNAGTGGADNYAKMKEIRRCNDILNSIGSIDAGSSTVAEQRLLKALGTLAKFGAFAYFMAETAQKIIDTVYNFSAWKQYAVQYNSKAFFNVQRIIRAGDKRRRIDTYQYLSSGLNSLQNSPDEQYNNLYKEDNVYIKINTPVSLLIGDNSQTSISKSKTCGELNIPINTKASVYYATIKRSIPNQYGQLDSIKYLNTGGCIFSTDESPTISTRYSTDPIFGGGVYLNKFSINNPTDLFTHPLYDVPDGFPYDYRSYKALAYPRYWTDSSPYEILNLIPSTPSISSPSSFPKESNLPKQKYNLDCKNKKGFSLVNDAYFYTSINGVFEFIAESEYNLDYRDWKNSFPNFYTKNTNLQKLFENKGENREFEEFLYDGSFSKKLYEDIYYQQAMDFDPNKDLSYSRNKTVYSLPSFKEQKSDSWLNFLPRNEWNFSGSNFGNLTAIKLLDDQKLIFLFDKSSPYITPGRAELKTLDNQTVYLGDGSLLREPRPLMVTDDNFGNCQSRFAFNQTKFGFFYPSQRKGNLFQYTSQLDEFSRNGNYYFFLNNLPSKLLTYFPNFKDSDNPYSGVGLTSSYDPSYETYYITKVDYVPKMEGITYNESDNTFYYKSAPISLQNPIYFEDAGFTISYSPSLKSFISFHDYRPVDYIATENHFFSIINSNSKSSIHQHNVRCDSYCNFYGVDYPHALTLPINNGPNVQILNSVEFQSETFLYNANCKDVYHELKETYNRAMIYNTEECSGFLNLIPKQKNNMSAMLKYDKFNYNPATKGFDIYIDKVEQKFRFNQFRDISIDRNSAQSLILTDPTGYKFNINPLAIDYNKSIFQRPKMRHTHSKLYLERTVSGANKILFYFTNLQQTLSSR